MDEQSLVKLYMDLTGSSEAHARSVLILIFNQPESEQQKENTSAESYPHTRKNRTSLKTAAHVIIASLVLFFLVANALSAESITNKPPGTFITAPISLEDAVNLAL